MKKKKIYTLILFVILYCLTVNVILNDINYTIAFVIYCIFFTCLCLTVCFISKRKYNKYIKNVKLETNNIIQNITKLEALA